MPTPRAWLTPGSPLEADALTVNPYLGVGALSDTLRFAQDNGKGVFVLAATSNPEARLLQSAHVIGGSSVAEWIAREIATENGAASPAGTLGSIGLVVGATVDRAELRLSDASLQGAPILAPGFGAQGARPRDLPRSVRRPRARCHRVREQEPSLGRSDGARRQRSIPASRSTGARMADHQTPPHGAPPAPPARRRGRPRWTGSRHPVARSRHDVPAPRSSGTSRPA